MSRAYRQAAHAVIFLAALAALTVGWAWHNSIITSSVTAAAPSQVTQAHTAAPASTLARAALTRTDQGYQLRTSQHSATFTRDGLHFQPLHGGPSWSWQLTFAGSAQGAPLADVALGAVAPRQLAPDLVAYPRGAILEQYRARASTVEQLFVIPQPLALHGADLLLEGAIQSPGAFAASAHGWTWRSSAGSVSLGDVTVTDAAGTRLPAHFSVSASQTQLRLDAAALARAVYPVTIDPEVGTNDFRISNMGPNGQLGYTALESKLAYNTSTKQYLVVWTGDNEADLKSEIYGQLVDARTGAQVGTHDFVVATMAGDANFDAQHPAVVYNPTQNEFVVVWQGTQSLGADEIFAQRVSAAGALVGGQLRVSNMGVSDADANWDARAPDVTYNSTTNQYLVVWHGDDNHGALVNNEFEIYGQLLGYSGGNLVEVGTNDFRISDMGPDGQSGFDANQPAVTYNSTNNQYLVVWWGDDDTAPAVDDQFLIWGQRLDANGGQIGTNDFRISTTDLSGNINNENYSPDVAYNSTTNEYMVVWEGDWASGGVDNEFEIWEQRLNAATGAAVGSNVQISNQGPAGDLNYNAHTPAIAYHSGNNEYLVVWVGDDNTAGLVDNDFEVFGKRLNADGTTREGTLRLSNTNTNGTVDSTTQTPDVAYSDTSINDYLLVWAADNPPTTATGEAEIWGQFVGLSSDLQITKTASPPQALPGQTVTYTINYTNAGPDKVYNVVLTDLVPAQLTGVSYSSTGPALSLRGGTTYIWDVASLNSGQGGSITITGQVVSAVTNGQVINNTASIATTNVISDPNNANNSASANVTVIMPVLTMTKTLLSSSAGVDAGDTVQYQLRVQHAASSSADAFSVNVSDVLPAILNNPTLVSAQVSDGAVTTDVSSRFSFSGSTLQTTGVVDLHLNTNGPNDQQLTIVVRGTVANSASPATIISNSASVTWRDAIGPQSYYTAPGSAPNITVPGVFNVTKTVTSPGAQVRVGDTVTYQVATSVIEGTTNNLHFVDTLPAGMTYVPGSATVSNANGMTINGFTPSIVGQVLTINITNVVNPGNVDNPAAADSDSFFMTYQAVVKNDPVNVRNGLTLTNNLDASADNVPSDTGNRASVTVIEPALSVTKTPSTTTPGFGQSVTYTVAVSHLPSSTASAYDLVITDTIPLGMHYVPGSASLPPAQVDESGNPVIVFRIPSVALGSNTSFTYQATVGTTSEVSLGDTLTNNIVMTWTSLPGPNANERTGSTTTSSTVTVSAPDVAIVKSATPTSALPGQPITYTLAYSNVGNFTASGVVITDVLPVQLTSPSYSSTGASLTLRPGAPYSWNVANLAPGAGGVITIHANVSSTLNADTTINNTAVITGSGDFRSSNNSSQATISVVVPRVRFSSTTYSVSEGAGTAVITATLNAANPYAAVHVNYATSNGSATAGSDYTSTSGTLTIPAGAPSATFSIPIIDDAIVEPTETVLLDLSGPSGAALGTPTSATLSILDNDVAGVTVTPTTVNVTEGGATATYQVRLTSQPAANVTISISPDSQTTVSPTSLTFTPANWNTPQTVTVTAVDDAVAEGPHTSTIQHSATSADANYNGITISDVTANITDNDTAGVTITPTTVNVTEGGATATYQVHLTSQPTANVTISISPDSQTTVSPTSLTFTPANWNTPQTVTVTAVDDAVAEGAHTSTIQHSASSSDPRYSGITISDVTANITDNDNAGVSVTPTTVNVTEGGATATYQVRLTSQPTANVTINISPDSQTTVSPTSLTFTTSNWNTPQTVTVTAVDDAVAEGAHTSTIQHSATSADTNYNGITISDVTANITDNDTAGVTVTPTTVNVTEGGATATYQVRLTSQPTANVTISITPDSQTTVSPTSLTFTTSNWNTPQTVTVTAVDDTVAEGPHTSTIQHSATSGDTNYNGITISNVTANITDNDSAGVSITPTTVNVTEGGATATYQVVLTSQPTATVTININPDSQTTVSPTSLTFTTSNWNTPQTVTVTAVDDAVAEGAHTSTIQHSATSADANYNGITISNVTANITDNDTAGVTVTPTSVSVAEGGATATYQVVLTSQPTSTVTININPDSQTTVSPTSLTFTSANWNTPQTVTVTAVDDAVAEGAHTSTIQHSASSADTHYNGITISDVTANITDNDSAGVTVTPTTVNVTEGGATATYQVVLTSQPTANVTISINPDSQTTVSPTSLTFTSANWNTPQTVTVTAVDDAIVEGPHTSTIQHSASSGDPNYGGITISDVTANITDNDTAGVSITPTTLSVTEGGPSATYQVRLTSQPTANVTINISPDSQTTVSPTSLTFTPANWNIPQTVTVTAVNDSIPQGPRTSTISHSATSGDANYNGITISNVTVNITDDDSPGVSITPTTVSVTEGGATATYQVVLTTQPSANVTITISPDSQTTVSPTSLTFTSANWNTPQSVTVTAVDDTIAEGPHTSTIQHSATSGDKDYNGITIGNVTANITDNDTPGVRITPTTVSVTEGGATATYQVVLASQPSANVTINISPDSQTTVSPTSLTFTSANWNTPRTVTVTAVDDTVVEGPHTSTIHHSATSGDTRYNGITISNVTANITDNDSGGTSRVYLPLIIRTNAPDLPDLVVDRIVVTHTSIQVVIRNQGTAAVTSGFWVDVYINPHPAPTHVNQIWQDLSTQGLVWGVSGSALPLAPGATLTLTIGDAFYQPSFSNFSGSLAAGTPVYAQVDSLNNATNYGGVLENHELLGGPYNNISSTVVPAGGLSLAGAEGGEATPPADRPHEDADLPVRPARPAK